MLASEISIDSWYSYYNRLTYLLIDTGLFFFDLLFESLQARSIRRGTIGL